MIEIEQFASDSAGLRQLEMLTRISGVSSELQSSEVPLKQIPVPEDVEAKLDAVRQGVDKWWTKDEVRTTYGDKPLPDGIGEHIIVTTKGGATTLENIVAEVPDEPDEPADDNKPQNPEDPDNNGDDDLTEAPTDESRAFTVVEE